MNVWECQYCPTIGKEFRVSDREYSTIIIDPGCPNCHKPWTDFKFRNLDEPNQCDECCGEGVVTVTCRTCDGSGKGKESTHDGGKKQ